MRSDEEQSVDVWQRAVARDVTPVDELPLEVVAHRFQARWKRRQLLPFLLVGRVFREFGIAVVAFRWLLHAPYCPVSVPSRAPGSPLLVPVGHLGFCAVSAQLGGLMVGEGHDTL